LRPAAARQALSRGADPAVRSWSRRSSPTDLNDAADAAATASERLTLADWRRRVADLYTEVRARSVADPRGAWDTWREVREWLYREHPQSPVPEAERAAFRARHFPYDPALRFEVAVLADTAGPTPAAATDAQSLSGGFGSLMLPISTGGEQSFSRMGFVDVPFAAGSRRLGLYWMAGYAGGLFLPFRDATNGAETYGAGRYLLDAAKSADLGPGRAPVSLILDFNFAFQPSCAFDPKWACPLSPPENRLDIRIEAGERLG
jgi:uncharacterized protein (DUF1684 family)